MTRVHSMRIGRLVAYALLTVAGTIGSAQADFSSCGGSLVAVNWGETIAYLSLSFTGTGSVTGVAGGVGAWATIAHLDSETGPCADVDADINVIASNEGSAGAGVGGEGADSFCTRAHQGASVGVTTGGISMESGGKWGYCRDSDNETEYTGASSGAEAHATFTKTGDVQIVVSSTVILLSSSCVSGLRGVEDVENQPIWHVIDCHASGQHQSATIVQRGADAAASAGVTLVEEGDGVYSAEIEWEFTATTSDFDVDVNSFAVRDDTFDADGDSRFSCADTAALQAMIGGAYNPQFDFDDDADIDQDDVDFLQALLDAGAGAGLAGDADGDCERTCADVELMEDAVAANAVFGDEEYSFAMDFDLDGDIDNDDLSALLATLDESGIDGDINADCCVNTADLGLLYAKFSQSCSGCPEDVNGDGVVNTSDLGILVGNMGAGCD